ncbi:ATP-binding protein [Streptomyces sp. NPDC050504]|uniref:sensor histidine kinase n=1 Tax=Streptomyces sp. NPDC050504 TaxID=3365618 RepID=UPI0037A5BB52
MSRARTGARVRGTGTGAGGRRRWSLRARLVLSAVLLIGIVAGVIGSVTAIAYRSYLYGKLDDQLRAVAERGRRPPGPVPPGSVPPGLPEPLDPLRFVGGGGQPLATFGVLVRDGRAVTSKIVDETGDGTSRVVRTALPLTDEQLRVAVTAVGDTSVRGMDLPGLGAYRVTSVELFEGGTAVVGMPAAEARGALSTLVVVEVCVTAAGLVAAGLAGWAIIGVALRPLRRVAATATRVAELPLHSGEVAPLERVPDTEADGRTEVGQVGAALNRMLDHVGSALAARQESETRVRRFVADASHELRTPLASIRGYAELTRRGDEPVGPDTRHAVGRIESEAIRMTGLVEDLLLLARLDAGAAGGGGGGGADGVPGAGGVAWAGGVAGAARPPLSYESTDLSPLVVDSVSDARAAERGRGEGRHWRLDLPDEPATVRGHPRRLQQILVNLLANARTHTPPGTTVTTRVRREGGLIVLEVADDGPGIPAELLPHVFERFARGDASRTRRADAARRADSWGTAHSTGLGLAIVQALATAHGGRAEARSEPRGGAVFTVRLPAHPVSQPTDRLTTRP